MELKNKTSIVGWCNPNIYTISQTLNLLRKHNLNNTISLEIEKFERRWKEILKFLNLFNGSLINPFDSSYSSSSSKK